MLRALHDGGPPGGRPQIRPSPPDHATPQPGGGRDPPPTAQRRANGRGSQRAVKRRGPHDWFEEREGESETDAIERAVRESYRNQSRLLPGDTGYEAEKHVQDVRPEKVT